MRKVRFFKTSRKLFKTRFSLFVISASDSFLQWTFTIMFACRCSATTSIRGTIWCLCECSNRRYAGRGPRIHSDMSISRPTGWFDDYNGFSEDNREVHERLIRRFIDMKVRFIWPHDAMRLFLLLILVPWLSLALNLVSLLNFQVSDSWTFWKNKRVNSQ